MRQYQPELDKLGVKVLVVSFDRNSMASNYIRETDLPWPVLLDSEARITYSMYGMSRGNWWAIYKPSSIIKYLQLILLGNRPGKPGRDWRQLGGDVLIDPNGVIRLHHVSQSPHDRPDPRIILDTIVDFSEQI